ncbi:MAG: DUF2183 domain-containing protein [Ruaniaceae bacterium]|nr:DUF2183 domain-containing protein [Ruaniaceae bacterium]
MDLPRSARFEDQLNLRAVPWLKARGWLPQIVAYTGYGSSSFARVLGRVVMHNPATHPETDPVGTLEEAQRGWHSFVATPVPMIPVTVRVGDAEVTALADRSGYIDVVVRHHGLTAGWTEAVLSAPSTESVSARVNIVPESTRIGIIADIDDTVMVTYLPRAVIAAWNTFVRHTTTRKPVHGMPELFQELRRRHPGIPVVYLSTGAWGSVPTLTSFLETHGYPEGPFLMTDWGPTATSIFRSGLAHKRTQLRRLAIEFPNIEWFLIGDDGQHDPYVYSEMAREHPAHVRAILIRQLNPVEQVLAHGTPSELRSRDPRQRLEAYTPSISGPDGHHLASALRFLPEA